jgi:hypothetical protein
MSYECQKIQRTGNRDAITMAAISDQQISAKFQQKLTGNQYDDLSCGIGIEEHSLWRKKEVLVVILKLLPPRTADMNKW